MLVTVEEMRGSHEPRSRRAPGSSPVAQAQEPLARAAKGFDPAAATAVEKSCASPALGVGIGMARPRELRARNRTRQYRLNQQGRV